MDTFSDINLIQFQTALFALLLTSKKFQLILLDIKNLKLILRIFYFTVIIDKELLIDLNPILQL